MSVSMFAAGINTNKVDDLFTSIGLIAPVKKKLHKNYQKLKSFIMDLSKIQLKNDRIYRMSIVRYMKNYYGDNVFEKNNAKKSYFTGSIDVDRTR